MKDEEIQAIVDRVMREVGATAPVAARPSPPPPATNHQPPAAGQDGIFPTLDEAVAAAKIAFQQLNQLPLEIRKDRKTVV